VPRVGPNFKQLAEFPTVVLESGWAESSSRLREDARLWQIGSNMAVRVVLQAKFFLADHNNSVRFVFFIYRGNLNGGSCLPDYYVSEFRLLNPNDLLNMSVMIVGDFSPTRDSLPKSIDFF